jgi:molybdopterin/thiamine biosynthesis adenylyltransferase
MLTDTQKAIYEWQMWVPDMGESGQQKLSDATVLISRCGGLGGLVAYELAAAGVGKLIIAHAGNVKHSDLHRQLLMTRDWIDKPRIESIQRRLNELNPDVEIVGVPENISESNVVNLVSQADLIVDCAPMFDERYLMNREAVRQSKPMVECAMYELQFQITTFVPGKTPCLKCLYPEQPDHWKRQFPVFGAVSGTVGCLGAMEAIKLITGIGQPLAGKMLSMDLRNMQTLTTQIQRRSNCPVCS